jgi:hypothetical protein
MVGGDTRIRGGIFGEELDLNFRWQAIKTFQEKKDIVIRIITALLKREKEADEDERKA